MIKTLLFDVDGVLVRGGPFSYHLERDYGISREQTGAFFKNAFPACLIGNADLKQELIPYLQQWGWQKSVDAFLTYWFVSEHNIDEPLVELVQQLRQQASHAIWQPIRNSTVQLIFWTKWDLPIRLMAFSLLLM